MLKRFASLATIVVVAGCTPAPVVDLMILPCPRERITEPACVGPPPQGTKRDQVDVFANELGCWRRVVAWDSGHVVCAGDGNPKGEKP